jgi:hypothetical protein
MGNEQLTEPGRSSAVVASLSVGFPPLRQPRASFAIRLVGAGRTVVDSADGVATLEAMSSHRNFRPAQHSKLVSDQPIAAPDEHAQLVEADQRFQAALDQAIAKGRERIEAVEATDALGGAQRVSAAPSIQGLQSSIVPMTSVALFLLA